jgi:hypothetical protein
MKESELREKIFILSEKYNEETNDSIESIKNEEEIECQTIDMIVDYMLNQKIIELKDIKSTNKIQLINFNSLKNNDIADINWYYTQLFYPGFYDSFEEFLEMCKVKL